MEKYSLRIKSCEEAELIKVHDKLNEMGKPRFVFIDQEEFRRCNLFTKIYEVEGEGSVVCQSYNTPKGPVWDFYLLGFDPQSEFYQEFKDSLEKLVKEPITTIEE